jgi:hypothetical protein
MEVLVFGEETSAVASLVLATPRLLAQRFFVAVELPWTQWKQQYL